MARTYLRKVTHPPLPAVGQNGAFTYSTKQEADAPPLPGEPLTPPPPPPAGLQEARMVVTFRDGSTREQTVLLSTGPTAVALWMNELNFQLQNAAIAHVQIGEMIVAKEAVMSVEKGA